MSSIAPQFIAPKEGRTAFRWAGDEEELVNHPFNQGLSVLQGIYGTLETAREHNWAFVDDAKNDLPNKLPEEKTLLRFMHPAHDGKPLTGGALAKMAKARHVSKNGEKIFAGAITKEANPKTAKKASKTKA